jgi:hypothetical protein
VVGGSTSRNIWNITSKTHFFMWATERRKAWNWLSELKICWKIRTDWQNFFLVSFSLTITGVGDKEKIDYFSWRWQAVFRIHIHLIRIQHFRLKIDPDPDLTRIRI